MQRPGFITAFAFAALAGGAAVLAGCTHDMRSAKANDGMGLHFNNAGGAATLAFGPANADATGLVLQCQSGSRQVDVSDIARTKGDRTLVLISGKARDALPARIDNAMGMPTLWARTAIDTPALQAFRQTGVIRVGGGAGGYSLTADRVELAGVEQFFRACDRAA